MKVVAVTGANGFIGSRICLDLGNNSNLKIIALVSRLDSRTAILEKNDSICVLVIGSIEEYTSWGTLFSQIDVIIHCAAKTPTFLRRMVCLKQIFQRNIKNTQILIDNWEKSSRKITFIFASSILAGNVRDHTPNKIITYEISKRISEKLVSDSGIKKGKKFLIVRLPPVYSEQKKCLLLKFLEVLVVLRLSIPQEFFAIKKSILGIENASSFFCGAVLKNFSHDQVVYIEDEKIPSLGELVLEISKAKKLTMRYGQSKGTILMKLLTSLPSKLRDKILKSNTLVNDGLVIDFWSDRQKSTVLIEKAFRKI
jgi:nucleoside-diphosphate-sugar epimerase